MSSSSPLEISVYTIYKHYLSINWKNTLFLANGDEPRHSWYKALSRNQVMYTTLKLKDHCGLGWKEQKSREYEGLCNSISWAKHSPSSHKAMVGLDACTRSTQERAHHSQTWVEEGSLLVNYLSFKEREKILPGKKADFCYRDTSYLRHD